MRLQPRRWNHLLPCSLIAASLLLAGCPDENGPAAHFSGAPVSGDAPLAVQFADASEPGDAPIEAWAWQFGDGGSSTLPNPAHTYTAAGTYSVTLTVTTAVGGDTLARTGYITVSEPDVEPLSLVEVPDLLDGENPPYPVQPAAVPAAGESVGDAVFGLSQTRVGQTLQLRHEYARHDPFNADGTMVLMQYFPDGDWRVYETGDVPYDTEAQFVRSIGIEEPRWDPNDPNLIWGTLDFSILRINVVTGDTTTIKNFENDATVGPVLTAEPDLFRITTRDEGESSADKRYWAFMIQGEEQEYRPRYLLVWDRQEDEVLGFRAVSLEERYIDWVGMSANGNWVIIGGDYGNGGDMPGLTMANRALTSFTLMAAAGGHGDIGIDSAGNEVYVVQNGQTDFIDLIPFDTGITAASDYESYTGSGITPLIRLYYDSGSPFGFNSGVHISCNYPGWCVVSTYTEPSVPEQNWLDRSIILVRLDPANPRGWYLAKIHGTCDAYWEETHASIARDGSRVIWASNWGLNIGQEMVFDLQLDLPAGWQTELLSSAR